MSDPKLFSKIIIDGVTYEVKDEVARQAISKGLVIKVVSVLPTASASTMGALYLVPDTAGKDNDVHIEYITVESGTTTKTYAWEQIGTTKTDLSDYSLKTHTHSFESTDNFVKSISSVKYDRATVKTATFSGTEVNMSLSGTPTGSISQGTGAANYTPAGTVTAPSVSISSGSTGDVGVMTSVKTSGSFPTLSGGSYTKQSLSGGNYTASSYTPESWSYTESTETLIFTKSSYTKESVTLPTISDGGVTFPTLVGGAMPTFNTTKLSASAGTPTFKGTGVDLEFTGDPISMSGKYKPSGDVTVELTQTSTNATVNKTDAKVLGTTRAANS